MGEGHALSLCLCLASSSSARGPTKSLLDPSFGWQQCPLSWKSLFLKPLSAAQYLSSEATLLSPSPSGLKTVLIRDGMAPGEVPSAPMPSKSPDPAPTSLQTLLS